MKVLIRVDSSAEIGWGHVYRCATLGAELIKRQAQVTAVCRDLDGNAHEVLARSGVALRVLPAVKSSFAPEPTDPPHAAWLTTSWREDAEQTLEIARELDPDWGIVDHYSLDRRWERMVGRAWRRLLVIDDTADREHTCDLLLDQNLHPDIHELYAARVPADCRLLLGPQYALLREEFRRSTPRPRDGKVARVLISFGGSDPANQTSKALRAWQTTRHESVAIDVVVGTANPFLDEIRALAATMANVVVHGRVENMAAVMGSADLAIGAPGSATWERCCLGLPAITIAIADNQRPIGRGIAAAGAVMHLGWHEEVSVDQLAAAIDDCTHNSDRLRRMAAAGSNLVDGLGAERVVKAMESYP